MSYKEVEVQVQITKPGAQLICDGCGAASETKERMEMYERPAVDWVRLRRWGPPHVDRDLCASCAGLLVAALFADRPLPVPPETTK